MFRIIFGLVMLALALSATTTSAGIIDCTFDNQTCKYSWDFESGNMPPNNGFDNRHLQKRQFQIFSGGAFDGDRFGRITVGSGDNAMVGRDNSSTERAEIMSDRFKNLSGVIHFGIAIRFGPGFNPHDERTLILQIKSEFERGTKNSPQFAIYNQASADHWKVCNNFRKLDECDYQNGNIFRANTWHRIVISQNASKGPDGWLKFYVDGKLIYSHSGATKYNAREAWTTFRTGIYRNNVPASQSVDVDNYIISRDLNAVANFLKLDPAKLQ
ncbi:MAG: heparin lyase I family protein [Rhodobacteraceae bacterium]|nr:heparin lyase I family protein [Paracoccaceae bacterium]